MLYFSESIENEGKSINETVVSLTENLKVILKVLSMTAAAAWVSFASGEIPMI